MCIYLYISIHAYKPTSIERPGGALDRRPRLFPGRRANLVGLRCELTVKIMHFDLDFTEFDRNCGQIP